MAVLVAVPLVGAVRPAQVPEVIEAREFRVLDEQGMQRASMEDSSLTYWSEEGQLRSWMGPDSITYWGEEGQLRSLMNADGHLSFFDEQENERARLAVNGLSVYDEQGTLRSGLDADWLTLYDEQGKMRSGLSAFWLDLRDEQGGRAFLSAGSLGFLVEEKSRLRLGRVTVVNQRTEAETTYPAALVLFDEEGNVIESLPR